MESRYRAPKRGFLSHRMGFFVSKKGRIWYRNGSVPGCLSAMLVGVVEPFSGTGKRVCTLGEGPRLSCQARIALRAHRSRKPMILRNDFSISKNAAADQRA